MALDGASLTLAQLGIKPNIIIGDLDSIAQDPDACNIWGIADNKQATTAYYGRFNTLIVPQYRQDLTDLHKAIIFIKQHAQQYTPYQAAQVIHIVTTLGQRVDHYLAGLQILAQEYHPNTPIYYHNLGQTIEYVRDRTISITGTIGDHCGIFGFPSGELSVLNHGLAYNVMAYPLHHGQYSCANSLVKEQAILNIKGSALIVHPPRYAAQRQCQTEHLVTLLQEVASKLTNRLYLGPASKCYQALMTWQDAGIMVVSHPLHTLATLNSHAPHTLVLLAIPANYYAAIMQELNH